MRTFSKIYGLASLRIGWGHGPKNIIDSLNMIKPPFNVNQIAQLAAIESLKDNKFLSRSIKHNAIYAKMIKKFLEKYKIFSNEVTANFLLLDFTQSKIKANDFYKKLKAKGVILRSTEQGYNIKNMLRLTIGSKKENLKFLNIAESILKK